MTVDEWGKEVFGEMRNLTEEEQESLYKGLDEISEETEIQLFDFINKKEGD